MPWCFSSGDEVGKADQTQLGVLVRAVIDGGVACYVQDITPSPHGLAESAGSSGQGAIDAGGQALFNFRIRTTGCQRCQFDHCRSADRVRSSCRQAFPCPETLSPHMNDPCQAAPEYVLRHSLNINMFQRWDERSRRPD
jgi:hypothetical protein